MTSLPKYFENPIVQTRHELYNRGVQVAVRNTVIRKHEKSVLQYAVS